MAKLLIASRRGLKSPNVTRIKKRFRSILKELSDPQGELSILFTGDSEMRRLNKKYRRKDSSTDVLSFPSTGGPGPKTLGDIVISIPTARRQAKLARSSLERETLFLLVHGLLHLLGYDHTRSGGEAKKMELLQNRLMAVGYGKR